MQNEQTTSKNSSQRTTGDIVNSLKYELANLSPSKQATTFLVLWFAGIAYMALTGCRQDYPTKTLSSESSTQETASSPASNVKTSADTRTDYTYQAQDQGEEITPPATLAAEGEAKLDKERTVTLSGIIDDNTFGAANQLIGLAEEDDDPIDIVISSPGGSVAHGLYFIQAMKEVKAKGIKIRCYVPTMAASMAFTIFTQCDERYALPYARLLFHSPRVSGTFTIDAQISRQLANGLTGLENMLLQMILPVMGVSKEKGGLWFVTAYNEERMFLASDLHKEGPVVWFTVVGRISGYPTNWPAPYPSREGTQNNRNAKIPSIREAGR